MEWLFVALGGSLGALSRFAVDRAVTAALGPGVLATFLVNIAGSFALGVFVAVELDRPTLPQAARPFLAAGFLASFTTFSTLTVASIQLIGDGHVARASANLLGSIAVGLAAALAGVVAGRELWAQAQGGLDGGDTVALSDRDIKRAIRAGRLVVEPYREEAVQPVSVDLTLGSKLRVFRSERYYLIDVKQEMPNLTEVVEIDELNPFILHPGAFVLGITAEWVRLPADLMGRLDGKSSLGRLGLLVHSTAGFIDPGFQGGIVLEFSNISPLPITLYAGMPIAQISFYQTSSPAERPYGHGSLGSKYQRQDAPTPSRYYLNFGSSGRRRWEPVSLRQWLRDSRFEGNVNELADALDLPVKAVEEWVYGRRVPNAENRRKLFTLTRLPQYAPREDATRQEALEEPDGL